MIKRVVILTHGINNTVEEAQWMFHLKAYLDNFLSVHKAGNEVEVLIHRWNPFLFKIFTFLPTISRRWRNKHVRKFQKYIKTIRQAYGPQVKIDVVAHSFGCYKTFHSMTLDSRQPKAFFNRLILVAPPISTRLDPEDFAGHMSRLHIFASEGDSTIAISPYGNAGYKGLSFAYNEDEGLYVHWWTPAAHSDYWEEPLKPKVFKSIGELLFNDLESRSLADLELN